VVEHGEQVCSHVRVEELSDLERGTHISHSVVVPFPTPANNASAVSHLTVFLPHGFF
jgi:hypothetical protein